jgi:hypothetical protein
MKPPLAPNEGAGADWLTISGAEKQFYRSCIERILMERDSLALFTCQRSGDHGVSGRKEG